MVTDLTSMKNWVGFGLSKLTVSFFSVGGAIIALYLMNTSIAISAITAIVFVLFIGSLSSVILRSKIRQSRKLRGRLSAGIGEIAAARGLSLHFNRIHKDKRKFRSLSKDMSGALVQRNFWTGLMRALPELIMPLTFFLMIWMSLYLDQSSKVDPIVFATSLFMIGLVMLPLSDVMLGIEYYLSYREGRFRLLSAIKRNQSIYISAKQENTVNKTPFNLKLSNMKLPGCKKGLVLSVKSGEATLITSDKTDMVDNLFYRIAGLSLDILQKRDVQNNSNTQFFKIWNFIRPSKIQNEFVKTISINDIDILEMASEDWHSYVKLISKDLPLIKGSIRKNVAYGVDKLSNANLIETLKICGIDDAEPEYKARGHQTRLHEDGKNISKSLRARIALARAVVTKPSLLLVNHPTFLTDKKAKDALFNVINKTNIAILMFGIQDYHYDRWTNIYCLDENGLKSQAHQSSRLSTKLRATL